MEENANVQSVQQNVGSEVNIANAIPTFPTRVEEVSQRPVSEVTSLADLQSYAQGTVVRLPDFAEGQPLVARLRRPSMLVLAKSGKIPNSLLTTANALFTGDTTEHQNDLSMLADMYDVCRIICEASLIQPSLQEIEASGLELSDNQMMAIFNYSQIGIKALESFR